MAQLPVEISSEIFMCYLSEDSIPAPDPAAAPMLLTRVCRSWSKLAVSTPSLWAAVHIQTPRADGFDKILELWLSRARSRPLSISLYGHLQLDAGIRLAVRQNARQVQTLKFYLPSGSQLKELAAPFPSLKTLILGRSDDEELQEEEFHSYDANECVEMLRAAPDLVHCTFNGIYHYVDDFADFPSPPDSELTHSNLKHLVLGDTAEVSSARILRSLTLPALESLTISELTISPEDLLAFLNRSSPPLESLKIQISEMHDWSAGLVDGVFQLLPGLTDLYLEFWGAEYRVFFNMLPPNLSQFLPHLSNFTITGARLDRLQYEKLVSLLSAWRTSRQSQMQTFELSWWERGPHTVTVDADILVALRQLVADGMENHIGPRETNYV
ncbi:hypothetical protein FB451DRAFT_1220921 [Mycena latifolia]|nr:hypothetical protein FB451DRAFT_1220921 [Mycena latifolia]